MWLFSSAKSFKSYMRKILFLVTLYTFINLLIGAFISFFCLIMGMWRIVSFFKFYFTLFLYLFKDFFVSYDQKIPIFFFFFLFLISIIPASIHRGRLKHPYRPTSMAAVACKERVTTPGCQELICNFHSFPWCSVIKGMRLRFFSISTLAHKSNCQILWEPICANMENVFNFLNNQLIHAFLEHKS